MADPNASPRKDSQPGEGSEQRRCDDLCEEARPTAVAGESAAGRELAKDLLIAQSQVLHTLARDASLSEMLDVFAETIERQSPDMLCSILLLEGNTFRHGAAPSLPAEYNAAVDGFSIGPRAGSCGTAAFTKRQVIVTDIATDPLWENYRELALQHGLRACWSTPILDVDGKVLGTFAMYYRTARAPTEHDRRLMEIWTQLAALGISRKRAEEAVRLEQQLLLHLFKSQEYDRQLAAFELHDGVAQYVAGAILHLDTYLQTLGERSPPDQLEIALHLLHKSLHESRRLINGLRPPILDECGVVAAIEHLVHEQPSSGPNVTFEHEGIQRLTPTIETALFRIAQEALTNACKHSNSPQVEMVLKREGSSIHLGVLDRGTGFTPSATLKERHGLRGIRERVRLLGGTVHIDSAPGRGTTVSVDLPLLPSVEGA